jgi:hypothetical protein
MNKHSSTFAALAVGLLLLASCGSSGGLGDILGGGTNQPTTNEIRGTVDRIDLSNKIIYLTNTYSSMLSGGGGSGGSTAVHYDNQTYVDFQGRTYRPEDLERGDEVAVKVSQSGNQLVADSVTVLRNVSGGTTGTGTGSGSYTSNVRGTVTFVDASRRTMTIDRGYGSTVTVDYDTNTYVTFDGRTFRPEDLERGDEVDMRVRDLGNGRLIAENVSVLRSVSGGGTSNTSSTTIRGTVRNHDPARRTIELEQANWISGFNKGAGTSNVIIQYPANIGIEVQGQVQSISGLERGDVIDVQVQNTGTSTPLAQRIILVRDVNLR